MLTSLVIVTTHPLQIFMGLEGQANKGLSWQDQTNITYSMKYDKGKKSFNVNQISINDSKKRLNLIDAIETVYFNNPVKSERKY